MKRKYKVLLVILLLLISIAAGALISKFVKKSPEKEEVKVEVLENIDGYDYKLTNEDSELYKEEFLKLKDILSNDDINIEDYSESVARLFVIDLFTIDTKINKYDIGGLDYFHSNKRLEYQNTVLDGLYKLVKDNSYGDRNQKLPRVKSIETVKKEKVSYSIDGSQVDAWKIVLSWTYEEDMGYDTQAEIITVKDGNLISVVEYNSLENINEEQNKTQ